MGVGGLPPLPPCQGSSSPVLPFAGPSSPRAAEALEAAAREGAGSRGAIAPAPLAAPFLTWPEALVALLRDVQRLRLATVRGVDGSEVRGACGARGLKPCGGEEGGEEGEEGEAAGGAAAAPPDSEGGGGEDREAAAASTPPAPSAPAEGAEEL